MSPDRPASATLTASGIARMAGVGRAAVSNWRRRYADFPAPAGGTAASPVFEAAEVEAWLRRQGKLGNIAVEDRLWRRVESVTPASLISEALCFAGAVLLSLPENSRPKGLLTPQRLLTRLKSRDAALASLAAQVLPAVWTSPFEDILSMADELEPSTDRGEVFEHLHAQYAASSRSLAGTDVTPSGVAQLLVSLAGEGETVFDFTSGTGSILHSAAVAAWATGRRITCYGQEIKPQHAFLTALRLWFAYDKAKEAGIAGQPPEVSAADSMLQDAFSGLAADVVVSNPPFGIHDWGQEKLAYDSRWTFGLPPKTEPELAWVQHALAHVAPGKRAVLLMPPAAAARPAGRRIRGELVRHGALLAAIALPAGLLPPAAIGLHVWVLTRPVPGSPLPRVLFVDSSGIGRSGQREAVLDEVQQTVMRAWSAYAKDPASQVSEPNTFHSVAAVAILDGTVDLTPRRHIPQLAAQPVHPKQTLGELAAFGEFLTGLGRSLPKLAVHEPAQLLNAPTAMVADLVSSVSISIHKPTAQRVLGEGSSVLITVKDVIEGTSPGNGIGSGRGVIVTPGDVLIPVISREVIARVATEEQVGAELGPGVYLLRADQEILDPWFLAGVLSRSDNARMAGRTSATSAGTMRIDVRQLAVPVLPIAAQRKYGKAFRQLLSFQAGLRLAAQRGDELVRDLSDGLASGLLDVAEGS